LEETGVRVSQVEFVAITNDVFTDEDRHYVTIWMRATPDEADPVLVGSDECTALEWFDLEDLPDPLFLSLANLLAGCSYPRAGLSTPEGRTGRGVRLPTSG
jgi:8-oxo-dGTP diphosphatase